MSTRRQGALAGVLSLAVSMAVASLVAAIIKVDGPIVAVGNRFIDSTPKWLKIFAIDTFGTNDKPILLAGIGIVLIIAAAALGIVARTKFAAAFAGTGVLAVVGALAATTRTGSQSGDWLPPVVGALAGLGAFWVLLRRPVVAAVADSPLAFDRRRFLAGAGALVVTSGGMSLISSGVRNTRTKAIATKRTESTSALPTPKSPAPVVADTATIKEGAEPYLTPLADFYRIDTALSIPQIDASTWRLQIKGMVDKPLTLTYADLLARPMIERVITISCVSNEVGGSLIGNARWLGVPLADLLKEAGVHKDATQVASKSQDGWTCGFPTALALDGRDAMIAIAMNGEPLNAKHGFPARIIVPGIYGYVSATKWLTEINLTTMEAFNGYWIPRGWAKEAPIKTQSRIDVPKRGQPVKAGKVAVAGVAWAMHRGVKMVEVQIDDGPWMPTKLADEPTVDAWRQWLYEWDATPGRHKITVRATDSTGATQTKELASPDPDGATGWHNISLTVDA
jgi:DMSO/TMAO reductase YedYZ molybdopterin-dependent catalytic subunit